MTFTDVPVCLQPRHRGSPVVMQHRAAAINVPGLWQMVFRRVSTPSVDASAYRQSTPLDFLVAIRRHVVIINAMELSSMVYRSVRMLLPGANVGPVLTLLDSPAAVRSHVGMTTVAVRSIQAVHFSQRARRIMLAVLVHRITQLLDTALPSEAVMAATACLTANLVNAQLVDILVAHAISSQRHHNHQHQHWDA
jgi:hypothetical protein